MDPAELRLKNFIRPEQFPYANKTGWEYDSGDYETTMRLAMQIAGYDELRREQAEKRARGELMGIGVSFFTETVGAGPRKHMDIVGLGMADGAEVRVHPTGKAVVRLSVQTQGQGHETTFAQILAEELGIPPEDIDVVHGDTDQTPFGLGTYGSRSTPVSGGAVALAARKVKDKARAIAAAMLETRPEDLEWEKGRWFVKGDPTVGKTIQEIALGAHGTVALPEGIDGNLDAEVTYDPPNLTFPYGAYICVVDVDKGTGKVKVRRFVAVDDCGTRINPMIIEGQIHGGLADGVGHGADGVHRLRRAGQLPRRLVHGLPDPHLDGGAGLGDRAHGHPVAAPPDRREGHRGVGDRRLAAGRRQRRRRRARAVRRHAHGHALHAGAGVGGHAGPGHPADLSGGVLGAMHDGHRHRRRADPHPGAVRPGHRGPGAEADQRARRRHRAGARRRHRSTASSAAPAPRRRCASTG